MDGEQEPTKLTVSSPVQTQIPIKTWRSIKKVSVPVTEKTAEHLASRFQGDGVRYKAKLIGQDEVTGPQGDKMCLDSMMKLKGWEAAGRRQGQHKQRVWLKVSTTGVRIVDERTGVVEHEHEIEKISSLKKDDSDPRAFSYIHGHNGGFKLFFIKMANAADPVIEDIRDVCQIMAQVERVPETPQTQNGNSLLLDEQVVTPQKSQSHDELTDLFAPPCETQAPISPTTPAYHLSPPGCQSQNPWASPQTPPAFPGQTLGVTPFTVSSATAWGPQGHLGAPYPSFNGPWDATGPWSTQQTGSSWVQPNLVPQLGPGAQSPGVMTSPGAVWGQAQSAYPTAAVNFHPAGREEIPDLLTSTTFQAQ
ncbi:disabled homolog 1-like [Anguilla rostrata]|uniref:disabled homolog 1-like n=1 Tax=Anguilla rostrata TaxID=7938 RepID=UPI0030D17342